MKKVTMFFAVFFTVMVVSLVAQERRPVIGLTEIKAGNGVAIDKDAESQVRAAISSAIVKTKRFAVMERSAAELDKIRQENLETSGTLNPNSQLDFLLTGEIIEYSDAEKATGGAASALVGSLAGMVGVDAGTTKFFTITVSIKFTDVQSGQIVLAENFTKSKKGKDVTSNEVAQALGTEIMTKITDTLYPPLVLNVSSNGIITIPDSNYEEGTVLAIFEKGEPIVDPYTGEKIGAEEKFIANVVVISVANRFAKVVIDPKGKFKTANIKTGMLVKTSDEKKVAQPVLKRLKQLAN